MKHDEFVSFLVDTLQSIGPVEAKRMFGGYGLFLGGLMFGLVADNSLYLKADDESKAEFEALGLEPFTYYKKGKPFSMSYYQAPEDALEDPDAMNLWGNTAYSAALRAAAKKPAAGKRRAKT